ncbi:MAG: SpoIIE family protein phosphatase [Lachnospiraceae bacterium]|nr:SpoIIE family protein phosphatase [Lachnospiraceae bacterium]
MSFFVDLGWKSLNKYEEELCGDKVEILNTEDSSILILADGMGSGIRANILATLTAKIAGTLFAKGVALEEIVETIASTLPVSSVNGVAYATFSILQIFRDGRGYLVEYDNPNCIFLRNKKAAELPFREQTLSGKVIRESMFQVQPGDAYILMSDGTIYCGVGDIMNYSWDRDSMAAYAEKCVSTTGSASRMANLLIDACNDLYGQIPSDDTTIAVARIKEEQIVSIFTGPPQNPEDDGCCVREFMAVPGKKIISGGITGKIASRELGRELTPDTGALDPEIPPVSHMAGIDLVTEGVVTLHRVVQLLEQYTAEEVDVSFFEELDKDNGACQMVRILMEDCTTVYLFVGCGINEAYQHKNMPFDVTARQNLVKRLIAVLEKMQLRVVVEYY